MPLLFFEVMNTLYEDDDEWVFEEEYENTESQEDEYDEYSEESYP